MAPFTHPISFVKEAAPFIHLCWKMGWNEANGGSFSWRLPTEEIDAILDARPRRTMRETATVMFTSGSTGRPKGVENTFANIGHKAMSLDGKRTAGVVQTIEFNEGDIFKFQEGCFTVAEALAAGYNVARKQMVTVHNPMARTSSGCRLTGKVVRKYTSPGSFMNG